MSFSSHLIQVFVARKKQKLLIENVQIVWVTLGDAHFILNFTTICSCVSHHKIKYSEISVVIR